MRERSGGEMRKGRRKKFNRKEIIARGMGQRRTDQGKKG